MSYYKEIETTRRVNTVGKDKPKRDEKKKPQKTAKEKKQAKAEAKLEKKRK